MGTVIDILLDTILDVLKILPFLFVTYLFLEWMEHQTGHKFERILENHRKSAPAAGAVLGMLPECGLPSAAASLYTTGVISAGTLAAVYLSCSDEMLPILISSKADWSLILPILGVKLIVALSAGYLADFFSKHSPIDVNAFCEREHDDHSHGILHSAILHTLEVTLWLLIITLLLNVAVTLIGTDTLRSFIANNPNKSVLVCTLVGMIPNCASSVLLTTMYAEHILTFPAVCAGLLANAGVGIMVLFRVNPNIKNNLKIVGYVWAVSLLSGILLDILL